MNSGQRAEIAAAQYLAESGYKIIVKNWRRPYAEIDIVATKKRCIYFVEVKYRATNSAGSGLEYITKKKLQQMNRAAQWWLQENKAYEYEVCLSVIAVAGQDYKVIEFIDELI